MVEGPEEKADLSSPPPGHQQTLLCLRLCTRTPSFRNQIHKSYSMPRLCARGREGNRQVEAIVLRAGRRGCGSDQAVWEFSNTAW